MCKAEVTFLCWNSDSEKVSFGNSHFSKVSENTFEAEKNILPNISVTVEQFLELTLAPSSLITYSVVKEAKIFWASWYDTGIMTLRYSIRDLKTNPLNFPPKKHLRKLTGCKFKVNQRSKSIQKGEVFVKLQKKFLLSFTF